MQGNKGNLPILGTSIDVQALDLAEGEEVNALKAASQFPNPDPVIEVPADLKRSILVTSVDYILNWGSAKRRMASHFWACVLLIRNDRRGHVSLRYRTLRR